MARALGGIDAVVIGASAGGIEALTQLLRALPTHFSPAVIIVQHLSRARLSGLSELFSSRCKLPVAEALDKQPVEPGHVYLAPPDYHLLVDKGPQLALSIDAPVHYSRPSIDVLFESAADAFRHALMGVVLTGANADGAEGLRAIRDRGGITVVQSPDTADYPAMPLAALALGQPDFVVSLETLCEMFEQMQPARALSKHSEDGGS